MTRDEELVITHLLIHHCFIRVTFIRVSLLLSRELFVEKEKEARYSDGDNLTTR